jgi:hypothetical protein
MQQIGDWLKTLGMSEYAPRFAEGDIDTSVLRDLTDQDLKDLGVSLGHRRRCCVRLRSLPVPFRHRRSLHLPSLRAKTPPSAAKSR